MRNRSSGSRRRWRGFRLLVAPLIALGSCDLINREFREVAAPAVETGVTEIVNGILDGIFAVIEPDPETTTDP